jgi:subtilisin-like proprotein convertase family protein
MLACSAGGNNYPDGDSDGGSGAGSGVGGDLGFGGNMGFDGGPDGGSGNTEQCGDADYTGGSLAIPDGLGVPYETSVTISGFGEGAVLDDASKFLGVCVNMEHTWIRDLQIELETPSGTVIVLNEFLGREGGEVYLGQPDDTDDYDPNPGVGYDYCWTPTASNPPMLDYCNQNFGDSWETETLPAGAYQASSGFGGMVGTQLNGTWTLRCIDDWEIDNGYIFWWTMQFDQSLIPDCDDWIIE